MGVGRFIKHVLIPSTYSIDMIKNMVDEGSIKEGLKRTIKENYTEDNPLTSAIYKSGKYDGKTEGYAEASEEYEKKLLDQADEFLSQTKIYEEEREKYEMLLDDYEVEIEALFEKTNKTELENEYLKQLLLRERKLRKMVG